MAITQTPREVSIDRSGKMYTGSYTVDHDVITVTFRSRSRSTPVGRTPVDSVAKLLLLEMVVQGDD
jgi:hypothetical protein